MREITLQAEKQLDSTGECIPRICEHLSSAIIADQSIQERNQEGTASSSALHTGTFRLQELMSPSAEAARHICCYGF